MDGCSEEIDDERRLRPNASGAEAVMAGLPAAKEDPFTDDMAGNQGFERAGYQLGMDGG